MSVPISDIVNVNIGVAPAPVGSEGFGNLLFVTDEVSTLVDEAERVTRFQTLAGVQEKFEPTTYPEVTAAATAYFAQVPTPLNFFVGAVLDAETPDEALAACREFDSTFTGVVLDKKYRDTPASVAVSDWCQATKVIFGHTTNDAATLVASTAEASLAGQIAAKANSYTLSNYSSSVNEYPSASALGRIFTTNYGGTDTTLTLMFKKLPSITVEDLGPSAKAALESVNCNAFLKVGGTSLYSESRMADGGWADTIHGLMWLESAIQLNVFNMLYGSPTKVPYTDTGISMVAGQVSLALAQGVRNGLLAAGNDADGNYVPLGYEVTTIAVSDIPSSDKGNRVYNGISFKAIGAGALHGVTISGNFNE